ncbi:hypothetical protein Lsan_3498 [Legionella santicrucis]|uniref:Uncharacterized protein n=1 Tax=Legionella santicrucis TaxID=45074 RepID=A0A0W0YAC3_9GAMM|nr:hypothetical protein [Legionella santicrucis]KTD53834.1 hypothetical protein Lsan_3498 [Legionella santicrucis]
MFNKVVRSKLNRSVIGAISKIGLQGLKQWDPELVEIGTNQLCRGVTRNQLLNMLEINQLTQISKTTTFEDVEHSDIARQVIRGGDPNLLSLTRNMLTANCYGANRYWLPSDGAIIVGCLPAVFSNISKQAKMCPQMCEKEQKRATELALSSGDYYKDAVDVTQLTIEVNEICAIVGKQKGVHFDGMYDVDKCIDKIYHVVGTGRPKLGLVPMSSCLVETFHNPDYRERALAVEIVLTQNPEYLEILIDTMRKEGELEPGQRVLTPDDAALIMGDLELRKLAVDTASSTGTSILSSVPEKLHGPEMLEYLKSESLKGLLPKEFGPEDGCYSL